MTIAIRLRIPAGYRWLAVQPWGGIVAFKRKPEIFDDNEAIFWNTQPDELQLLSDDATAFQASRSDWKQSLQRLR